MSAVCFGLSFILLVFVLKSCGAGSSLTLLWGHIGSASGEYSRERLLKFTGVGLHQTLVPLTLARLKSCDSETPLR